MLTKVREYFYVLVLMLNLTFGKYSGLVDSASYVRSLLAASPPESNLSPKSHVLNLLPTLTLSHKILRLETWNSGCLNLSSSSDLHTTPSMFGKFYDACSEVVMWRLNEVHSLLVA